jgi:hypothetical protein
MSVNEINFFIPNDAVQLKDVRKSAPQTPLVNRNGKVFGLSWMGKLARSDKNPVSIRDLGFDEHRGRGFRPCHKIAA